VLEQKDLVKEVEYELKGKKYFGIGFLIIPEVLK
jgi:hypothetical protein